jgi:hypothetical protein
MSPISATLGNPIELIPISVERVKKDHDRAEKGMILYKVSSSTGKIQTIKFEDMFKGIGMSQDESSRV